MSDADDDYIDYLFSNYTGESKTFWTTVSKFVQSLGSSLDLSTFVISLIGILANTFHLIVLTRKSMRNQTVNLFLTGIAFCDLARMFCVIAILLPMFNVIYIQSQVPDQCLAPQWYITMVISTLCVTTNIIVQQLSIWYAVTIAILRTLVVWYPFNPRICSLIDAKYGIRPFLFVTAIFVPFWIISYSEDYVRSYRLWTPPPECTNFPSNYSIMEYYYDVVPIFGESSTESYLIALVLQGVLCKLVPCVILPLATISLILGLNKSRRLTFDKKNDSNQRSTKLVIFMTLSFFIANFPLGLLYLTEVVVHDSFGLAFIAKRLTSVFTLLNVVNGTVHFLICFFMSSQYRATARNILNCCGPPNESVQSVSAFTVQTKTKSANSVRSLVNLNSGKIE
ncbi:unnamed protein product [Caenorhabditis brenneri]